ncbi:MAG: hypothetical protein KDH99_02925 [Alcanivoracaceae bacterium]|nr:hypothetical protein [Alcanivoracaceae bacterium]
MAIMARGIQGPFVTARKLQIESCIPNAEIIRTDHLTPVGARDKPSAGTIYFCRKNTFPGPKIKKGAVLAPFFLHDVT